LILCYCSGDGSHLTDCHSGNEQAGSNRRLETVEPAKNIFHIFELSLS